MAALLVAVLVVHGALHALGFVQAFGLAAVPALSSPITRSVGLLWLLAALGFVATAVLRLVAPASFWLLALPSIALSQAVTAQRA